MRRNYIDELIQALERVVSTDKAQLRELLILSGMPEPSQNLRYVGYNRRTIADERKTATFSAVAVINNRRADHWQLGGYHKKLSQWVFSSRWTRNPLDLFLNALRCDAGMIGVLKRAATAYTVIGILETADTADAGFLHSRLVRVRPVVGIPGLAGADLETVIRFESDNEIQKRRLAGFQYFHKTARQMAG